MYYKHTGETTTEFIDRLCIIHGHEKGCVCGKLDPMSRGITKILFDNETKEMKKHLDSVKTYEFSIITGISTDSDDIMGNIKNVDTVTTKNSSDIIDFIFNYKDKTEQLFHPISAIRIKKNGIRRPLWHWKKNNMLTHKELPSKKITVFNTELITRGSFKFENYLECVIKNLNTIKNKDTFKVESIIDQWKKVDCSRVEAIKFKMTVSSGFYIRMLAYEIKRELGIPVHIYDIYRTNVQYY